MALEIVQMNVLVYSCFTGNPFFLKMTQIHHSVLKVPKKTHTINKSALSYSVCTGSHNNTFALKIYMYFPLENDDLVKNMGWFYCGTTVSLFDKLNISIK